MALTPESKMIKPDPQMNGSAPVADAPKAPPPVQKPSGLAQLEEALEEAHGKMPERDPNRKKTAGELIFDRVVYTGIGFGVNEASSLWITDQFMHGKPKWFLGGKPFSHEGFEAASKAIAKTFKMPVAKAGNTLLMATLLSGGTLLVLPMRYLEENKITWTRRANHLADYMSGNKLSKEEVDVRDKEVEQAIACSPQQGWGSLLAGRAVAMFASWATGTFLVGPKNNEKIMDFSEKHISNAAKGVGFAKAAKTDIFKRYARLIGVETYSCAESSVVLEVASKILANRGTEIHDPELCKAAHGPNEKNGGIDPEKFRKPKLRVDAGQPVAYADKVKLEKENAATLAV